jgi:hypothetical protein
MYLSVKKCEAIGWGAQTQNPRSDGAALQIDLRKKGNLVPRGVKSV